eukprot:TRINITY_DN12753_c0_g1_i1.p1 TRINITY_DN12753_c0_g1~~TRINITY_DN12753_c0_g1_i1.p1  ORF type:complete len:436 (+),score=79.08 TRINITY_DN12753_c0_g1_i1:55-1362(+)
MKRLASIKNARPLLGKHLFAGTSVRAKSATTFELNMNQDYLSVSWGAEGGESSYKLNPVWLRERCLGKETVDVDTRQPVLNPHDFGDAIALSRATLLSDSDIVEVAFSDGHVSQYNLNRLKAELEDFEQSPIQVDRYERPPLKIWTGSDFSLPKFDYEDVSSQDEVKFELVKELLTSGIALVRGVPRESHAVVRFGQSLSTLRDTNWGNCFNVRTKPDAESASTVMKDLAYTPKAIGLHTDNPYRWPTPDFQLLHAIDHCVCEGEAPCAECSVMNFKVDGYYIAELLRKEDPEAFELLCSVPVRFENDGGDGESALVHVAPHFEVENSTLPLRERNLQAIRFSAKSGQYAPQLEPSKAAAFYRARRRFSEMAHDPKHIFKAQLNPGDCFVFNNQRILHARSEILPTDGERWVQGCYIDRDGLWLKYERFRRMFSN